MNLFLPRISIAILIVCLLVACGAAPTASPTPLPPTIPPAADPATLTPTPQPTEEITSRPARVDPTGTATAIASECNRPMLYDDWASPRGTWMICGVEGGDFDFVNRDGSSWHFSTQEQFGVDYHGYMGLIDWTADEKFLYFSIVRDMGSGGLRLNLNTEVLFRVDLSARKASIVLGDLAPADLAQSEGIRRHLYVASISPTTRRLAYSLYKWYDHSAIPELHFLDLQNNSEKVFEMEPGYVAIGNFGWSDDGLQFVYKLYAQPEEELCAYTYSMRFLDLRDLSSNTFVKNVPLNPCEGIDGEFMDVEVSDTQVVLEKNYEIWVYDVKSQRLKVQGTMTPFP